MKSITPTEFDVLPEAEKEMYREISRPTYLYNGTSNSTPIRITEYVPVMIPLAEASKIVMEITGNIIMKGQQPYQAVTEALTKLKNLNGNDK